MTTTKTKTIHPQQLQITTIINLYTLYTRFIRNIYNIYTYLYKHFLFVYINMVVWGCDKCDYHTTIKRDIIKHMNNKRLCRTEVIIITKEIANTVLATNSESIFKTQTTTEVIDTIKELEEELEDPL